ncbi:MAG: Aspartyl/glutamyl-tRNA(Asn/Gln) amidotransferase subunit C [Parcubacteria group bacterium GW2011_GWA1_50_14]|nr:MAG: Aspartyl/glutamyl-tRNA(Asn/Gln) amidotransferase subunit C [Parcubacteria group bacterium GW2011_GWA1_50_14]
MISKEEVAKLAGLARLKVPAGELDKLAKDLEAILGYVSELKSAPIGNLPPEKYELKNVLRPDEKPHEPGLYTDDLLAQVDKTIKGYVSVKPILNKE